MRETSLRVLLRDAANELLRCGVAGTREAAMLDADVLLRFVLRLSRTEMITKSELAVSEGDELRFRALLDRRKEFEPVAYLTGKKEFYGLEFAIEPSVLIPRPETELLVERSEICARSLLSEYPGRRLVIADVGIGSGAVLLSLLKNLEDAGTRVEGIGIDISADALRVAELNRAALGVVQPVRMALGNLLAPIASPALVSDGAVVLVVSNPPYIGRNEVLMPDVSEYEPAAALYGGAAGHELAETLIEEASVFFSTRRGALLLEVGQGQADRLVSLECIAPHRRSVFKDLSDVDRVIQISWADPADKTLSANAAGFVSGDIVGS